MNIAVHIDVEESGKYFVDIALDRFRQGRTVGRDEPSITVLLENDSNCVLESEERVSSCSMVHIRM